MGEDRERDKQIRNGDVGRDSHRRHWKEYRETRCEGKTETCTKFYVIFYDGSSAVSWAETDTHRTRRIRQKFLRSIEIDDQIAATWWHSTSPRWRSSQIPRLDINISFRIYVFFALVNSNMAKFLAKRRWSQEKVPIFRGTQLKWNSSILSNNSRPFWRKTHWSYIARQRVVTERLRRAHLSRWKLPWYLHSIIQSGLIPGGKSVKKGRHAVCFTTVNPMIVDHQKEVEYDLTKPRTAVCKNKWKIYTKTVYWCNMRVAQRRGMQFNQKWSNAIILENNVPAVCASRWWWTWSQEYSKTFQSLELPQRIILNPNLHYGCQDTTNFEARASVDHLTREYGDICSGREYGESLCGNIDFRVQRLPHSSVHQQDDTRKEAVKKLIHQFETHPNREALKADLEKDQAFNLFSEKSKDMIRSMGNTEYFEMC